MVQAPSEASLAYWQRAKWAEGLVLLLAYPLLLFPERAILLTAVCLLFLGLLWLAPLVVIRSPLIPPTPWNAALVLFGLATCAAILVSSDPQLTLPKAAGLILGLATWRYLVIALQARSRIGPAVTMYVLLGMGFILTGLLNANWLLKNTSRVPILGVIMSQLGTPTSPVIEGSGIHPNQIAGTITLVLPLLFALAGSVLIYGRSHRRVTDTAILLTTLFSLGALVLTQSRSGWVGVIAGLLTLFITGSLILPPSSKRRALRLVMLLSLALIVFLVVLAGPTRIQQLWLDPPNETVFGSLVTLNYRQYLWPWAVQAIRDFPYTGMGLGTFRAAATRLYPIPIPAGLDFAHAHNVFLQVTLDLGIPGLIAYSALFLLGIALAWQIAVKDVTFRAYAAGLLASLIAFHIYGLADTMALGSKSTVLLWANLGLLAAMTRLR